MDKTAWRLEWKRYSSGTTRGAILVLHYIALELLDLCKKKYDIAFCPGEL